MKEHQELIIKQHTKKQNKQVACAYMEKFIDILELSEDTEYTCSLWMLSYT